MAESGLCKVVKSCGKPASRVSENLSEQLVRIDGGSVLPIETTHIAWTCATSWKITEPKLIIRRANSNSHVEYECNELRLNKVSYLYS